MIEAIYDSKSIGDEYSKRVISMITQYYSQGVRGTNSHNVGFEDKRSMLKSLNIN